MALTFEQAFGNGAMLRRHSGGTNNPFYVESDAGTWVYNPQTGSFDLGGAGGQAAKSIRAADLGLTRDPMYEIAGLASLSGQNGDSWSHYALTHNDYGGGVGSQQSMMAGASDLRGAIGDIAGYENKPSKSAWVSLRDFGEAAAVVAGNYLLPGSGLATSHMVSDGAKEHLDSDWGRAINLAAGVGGGINGNMANYGKAWDTVSNLGTTSGTAGTGTAEAAGTAKAVGTGDGYLSIPQHTPMGMSTATPGMSTVGTTATGDLIGYGTTGEIIGGASGLDGLVPQLDSSVAEATGPLSTVVKTAKTASQAKSIGDMLESGDYLDAAKTIGGELLENAPSIGTLLSILSDDGSGQTIGGQGGSGGSGGAGGSAAWMNQALPTINIPAYRSNVIQGDPYKYGMGAEQALYTDQSGNLPRAQNFGTSGGRPFGVQYNFEQAPAQSGGLASIQPAMQQPAIQPAMQQPAKQALTQQDVTSYLSSKGLDLTPEGVQRGLAIYNSENPNSQLTQSDIGAAFGFSPEQSSAWMYEGQTKAPSVLEAQNWYKNQYAPTQTQSGGLAALTQKDVTDYLSANNLQFDPQGINTALAKYNGTIGDPSKQYSINDVGAAFGYTPEQSRAWMQGQTQVTAPAPVQAAAKPALTQQDVTAYLAANNLNLDPSGISNALARYNAGIGNPADQYSINDVGAAFGYTPEQSRAWMQGQKFAEGGAVGGYNCGGLSQAFDREEEFEDARYVAGDGGGQDDDVDAMLSSGEYVFDADVVSALGDGNNEAGARILDELRAKIRQHKRAAPANKIPPKAKSIEQYLKEVR